MVGGTWCLLLNQWGLIVGWAWATAHVAENTFQGLSRQCEERMIIVSDTALHATEGDPATLADRGLLFQAGHAPRVNVWSRPARVHHGRL